MNVSSTLVQSKCLYILFLHMFYLFLMSDMDHLSLLKDMTEFLRVFFFYLSEHYNYINTCIWVQVSGDKSNGKRPFILVA